MEMYKLEELTTVSKLRSNIGDKFRNNAGVQNEDAVKLLIHKGREELDLVGKMHKQRHHIITSYIVEHSPVTGLTHSPPRGPWNCISVPVPRPDRAGGKDGEVGGDPEPAPGGVPAAHRDRQVVRVQGEQLP